MIPHFKEEGKSLVFNEEMRKKLKGRDIIVIKVGYTTYINDHNEEVKRRIISKVNITEKVNESKKLLKTQNALEKSKEYDKIFEVN